MTSKIENQAKALESKPSTTGSSDMDCPRVNSAELFEGGKELRIHHADREYRLRVTRLNKLILTV